MPSPMGAIPYTDIQLFPLSWQEIAAFRAETGAISQGWESETIHAMSAAYCVEASKAENPFRIPPMDRGKPKEAYDLAAEASGE